MTVAKYLKFANAILCEYAAKGEINKHTLVNVLCGDIVVRELPAKLHLGIYLEYIPDSTDPIDMQLHIALGEKTVANILVKLTDQRKGFPGMIVIPSLEVGIDKNLKFTIKASCEGYRKTTILSKRIYQGELPANLRPHRFAAAFLAISAL